MAAQAIVMDGRHSELWRRLAEVADPELDEPVTEMGFVEHAAVGADGSVQVDFRLPTYWCSPNFAYLMLDGIRQALEALSWAPRYRLTLHDHMFAEEVNAGIAAGRTFADIFADLSAGEDLSVVRETFARKAYCRRQEAVIVAFREHGLTDREILSIDLAALDAARFADADAERAKMRFRDAVIARWPAISPSQPVFLTWEGVRIGPDGMAAHLAELRGIRINMEFNGALCRGLKATRYKEVGVVDGEPTLVDFILDRVPARTCEAGRSGIA